MRRWLLLCAFAGPLLAGCFDSPAQETTTADDRSSSGDPHAGMSSMEGAPESAAGQPLGDSSGPVELDAITLTAPAGWQRMPPSSSFVAAEFALPRAEGDDANGRLTISTAGGTVEANIDRWKGQFDAQAKQAPPEEIDVAGLKVTLVDLSGDFSDQRGPFAPAVERPGYRMIAAIVPVEGQLHFIKATGPQKTIASHADKLHEFIRTVQRKQ
jgi:hypothetical protein